MNAESKLYRAILDGDAKTAVAVSKRALEDGAGPIDLVTNHMIPAMGEVGRRLECAEYFVPELLLSGRAMKAALEIIRPLLALMRYIRAYSKTARPFNLKYADVCRRVRPC